MMYNGKKILVLGLARSGYSVAKLLVKKGASVVINDISNAHDKNIVEELESLGVKLIFGDHPNDLLSEDFDLMVKNPGIPLSHPYVVQAKVMNLEVTTEVEVAYNCMSDANYIAITGTNGKTTTATLIYEMLKKAGKNTYLVGNIGNPISNYYDQYTDETVFVVEISAQQLYDCKNFKPNVAILTNLAEAHLEFFENVELYYQMKINIFNNMLSSDVAIINGDCEQSLKLTYNITPKKLFFSIKEKVVGGYYDGEALNVLENQYSVKDIKLIGKHNYQNILCAVLAVKQYGIADDYIMDVLADFNGVAHRLEYVRTISKVKYYNDSKSTNIDSCKVALDAFKESVTLILGGLERGQDFEELFLHMNYVSRVYCYGETKERIYDTMMKLKIDCVISVDLQDAVNSAREYAKPYSVVLFSPACASWDQFDNFEQRGDAFKLIVNSIN